MPDGSSSAAPVINPGPRFEKNLRNRPSRTNTRLAAFSLEEFRINRPPFALLSPLPTGLVLPHELPAIGPSPHAWYGPAATSAETAPGRAGFAAPPKLPGVIRPGTRRERTCPTVGCMPD